MATLRALAVGALLGVTLLAPSAGAARARNGAAREVSASSRRNRHRDRRRDTYKSQEEDSSRQHERASEERASRAGGHDEQGDPEPEEDAFLDERSCPGCKDRQDREVDRELEHDLEQEEQQERLTPEEVELLRRAADPNEQDFDRMSPAVIQARIRKNQVAPRGNPECFADGFFTYEDCCEWTADGGGGAGRGTSLKDELGALLGRDGGSSDSDSDTYADGSRRRQKRDDGTRREQEVSQLSQLIGAGLIRQTYGPQREFLILGQHSQHGTTGDTYKDENGRLNKALSDSGDLSQHMKWGRGNMNLASNPAFQAAVFTGGSAGNPQCWDQVYSYEKCCFMDPQRLNTTERARVFGCGNAWYTQYRYDSWVFYRYGEVHPRFLKYQSSAISTIDQHMEVCPASALNSLLFKLQEDMPTKPIDITQANLMYYTSIVQRMVSDGRLTQADMKEWPLELGLAQLDALSPRVTRHYEFVARSRRRKHQVELVIAYCKESYDGIWLWLQHTFSRLVFSSLKVTVVLKCGDTPERRKVPQRLFNHTHSLNFLEVVDDEIQADECSGYFGFLSERYHTLSDYTIFVHPDAHEHVMLIQDEQFESYSLPESVVLAQPGVRLNPDWEKQQEREKRRRARREAAESASAVVVEKTEPAEESKKRGRRPRRRAKVYAGQRQEELQALEDAELDAAADRGEPAPKTRSRKKKSKKKKPDKEKAEEEDDAPEEFQHLKYLRSSAVGENNILEVAARSALYGNTDDMGYQSLGHNRDTSPWESWTMNQIYRKLFRTNVDPPVAPRSYCCSHFMVSKQRIQRRTREFYSDAKDLFVNQGGDYSWNNGGSEYGTGGWKARKRKVGKQNYVAGRKQKQSDANQRQEQQERHQRKDGSYVLNPFPIALTRDVKGRWACQLMMKFWHLVFGHPQMRTPLRHRDHTVPFFLKGRNMKSVYENE